MSGVCTLCQDPSDDQNCTSAYGAGTTPYICDTAGSCVAGNCHTDANCTAGQICGVTTANTCGTCTADTQCQSDPGYGLTTICNTATGQTTTGQCVASTCTTANSACPANSADFCCPGGGVANACVPGNCCTNADCASSASGTICGATTANVCGPCTADAQCAAGQVCDTLGASAGKCVTNVGLCTGAPNGLGGAPGTCANIGSDVCCASQSCFAPASSGTACCPGLAGNTYCQGALANSSATCTQSNTCTTCDPVSTTAPVYVVDPVNGSDGATGSAAGADAGASESCALKTLTRALQLISVVGTALPTKIIVVGGAGATISAGETFPLTIPTHVTVTTQTGPVTVQVASGKAGFVLSSPSSSLTSGASALLTITTTVNSGVNPPTGGTHGIVVGGTASSASGSTSISNVTVTGMLDDGILVGAGSVAIGQGVTSSSNGIATATRAGLHVTGSGAAAIAVQAGSPPSSFSTNTAHGILVDGGGSVTVSGTVTSATAGTGTVTTNGNVAAGVWIEQTPGANVPQNVLSGLVSFGNTGGNGLRIVAGSSVQVRSSVFLANQANGVVISTANAGGTPNNDISKIDLGTAATSGGNTFQAAFSGGPHNGGAGICLATAAGGASLSAVGNQFSATNCATTAATLLLNPKGCGNSVAQCPSGVCDLGLQANGGTPNTFNVSMCAQ